MSKRNKQILTTSQKLSNFTQIPFDMTQPLPYICMCSNREIMVEDAGKLLHYDCECIKVKQRNVNICIEGKELKLMCLANNDMRVTGFICRVCFE